MKDEALRLALKLAFRMGQDYWYHADHEFSSYHKKADAIRAEFDQLVEKTIKQALANDALDRMADNERELGIQMQPEPEPVAYAAIVDGVIVQTAAMEIPEEWRTKGWIVRPLVYGDTSPPKREPLTDEEIWNLAANCLDSVAGRLQFARAIEAAHGIFANAQNKGEA